MERTFPAILLAANKKAATKCRGQWSKKASVSGHAREFRYFECVVHYGWFELRQLDVPGQSQHAQDVDPDPVHVELVPREPMPRRLGMSMVVVMPALAP